VLLPPFLRLTKKIDALTFLYRDNLRLTSNELQLLSGSMAEMQVRLRPYRRLGRWLGHPITLALLASYRRRRTLRRSDSPAG
jgi:hypothetical protein